MLFCAIDINDKQAKVFPVSSIFNYQYIAYDFHGEVEAFVREQGEGGIDLRALEEEKMRLRFLKNCPHAANLGQRERGVW